MPGFRRGGGKNFSGRGGGYNRGGGYGGNRGRDRGQGIMHQAVCAECGAECEVPFKPTGDRPVYCNACFGGKKNTGAKHGSGGARESGGDLKKQLEMLNGKMDVLIAIVESMAHFDRSLVEGKNKKAEKTISKTSVKKQVKKAPTKK